MKYNNSLKKKKKRLYMEGFFKPIMYFITILTNNYFNPDNLLKFIQKINCLILLLFF